MCVIIKKHAHQCLPFYVPLNKYVLAMDHTYVIKMYSCKSCLAMVAKGLFP